MTEQAEGQSWLDPWLKLRDMTAQRNDMTTVATRYSQMKRLAIAQYNDLKERSKVKQDTLDGLLGIIQFCGNKADPLWDKVQTLEKQMETETERLQNG